MKFYNSRENRREIFSKCTFVLESWNKYYLPEFGKHGKQDYGMFPTLAVKYWLAIVLKAALAISGPLRSVICH